MENYKDKIFSELKGKKLLFLGGPALMCDVVRCAKNMGVFTMVTDWYPASKSPAKLVADKSFMTSNADVDAVVDLIQKENIDGVLTGFTDSTLPYYQKICEKAGLPCYITPEQFFLTANKGRFKQLCKSFGVPVVPDYTLDINEESADSSDIRLPVLMKPVDNSGARGISVCHTHGDLKSGFSKALSFSDSGKVLVEKYMTGKEVTIFYLVENGNFHLMAMGDRHMRYFQEGIIPLPVAYTFPSKFLEKYQASLDGKVKEMFMSIGLKNGVIFIQSFIENDEFVFYEMGFRLTGSLEYKIINKIAGVNPLEMLINFSLTGKMIPSSQKLNLDPFFNNKAAFNITFLATPGVIGKICGVEKVLDLPGVIDVVKSYNEGQEIPENVVGTLRQVVMRVLAVVPNKESLPVLMDKIHSFIEVRDSEGENMLLAPFDTKELIQDGKA